MAERLDLSDGFDVHDYRSRLKLRTQDGSSMYLENREGLECPACGRAFDRLFGSLGTLMALMIWLKLLALAILVGFELNVTIENSRYRSRR